MSARGRSFVIFFMVLAFGATVIANSPITLAFVSLAVVVVLLSEIADRLKDLVQEVRRVHDNR